MHRQLQLGTRSISNFKIQIGDMDYGFEIDGIIGLDYLLKAKVIIDLETLTLV
ncbi:hypothetical protein N752_20815 [Desulforamulus aquiferis]|nr:hypothetical protein N752_20815 [Desulforamulus aquiferis]